MTFTECRQGNKFGLFYCHYSKTEWLLKPEYEAVEKLADEFYRVQAGNKFGLIFCYNDKLYRYLSLEFETIEYIGNKNFIAVRNSETKVADLSLVEKGKMYLISLKGLYSRLEDGNYLVQINGNKGLSILKGKKRRWILPPKYKEIIYIEPNVYLVSDGKQSYFFKNGKLVKTDRAYTGKEIVFVRYA